MYRYLLVLFSCVSLCARGQVTVRLQAPAQTEVGDQIRVSYVVNTSDVEDFKLEKFQGFDELYASTPSCKPTCPTTKHATKYSKTTCSHSHISVSLYAISTPGKTLQPFSLSLFRTDFQQGTG